MLRLNQSYGHRKVLLAHAGYSDRPVHAFLQHGWTLTPDAGSGRFANSSHFRRAPRLFWSRRQAREASAMGVPFAKAVGAPFLYLARARDLSKFVDERDEGVSRVLVYPRHSAEFTPQAACLEALDSAAEAVEAGCSVTICLHPVDAVRKDVIAAYERVGCRVTRHGTSRYDQGFLDQQLLSLLSHDVVWSYGLGSAALYAAVCGLPVEFREADGSSATLPGSRDFGDRRDVYEELLECGSFRGFAMQELGDDLLIGPEEMASLLGVRGVRSVEARVLRRAGRAQAAFRRLVLRDVRASG